MQNINAQMYKTREAFLEDVELIFKNSYAYNGKDSQFTHTAERMVEVCKQALSEVSRLYINDWLPVQGTE